MLIKETDKWQLKCTQPLSLSTKKAFLLGPKIAPPQLINSGGSAPSSALTLHPPHRWVGQNFQTGLRWSETVRGPDALHHECLCAEPHKTPGQYLWAPAGGFPAGSGSAAAQGSPALPAQAVAAQSSPGVPVPSFTLAVRAQPGGKWERDRGEGGQGGQRLSERGHGQQVYRTKPCCEKHVAMGAKPRLPLRSWLLIPCAGVLSLSDPPSLGRTASYYASQPFEDKGCSFLNLPAPGSQNRTSPCFPAHVHSFPSCLPGPELAWEHRHHLMNPCLRGFTACVDNRQEFREDIRNQEKG